jgi:hypothetical protein
VGRIGPALLRVLEVAEELEKTAGLFRQPTSYERFAEWARKRASLPVNPYSVATKPVKSAVGRVTRMGVGGAFGKLWRGALVGMAAQEFVTGMKSGLAANRKAIATWGM